MRAVKSVLVVAGKLKRAEPGLPEDSLLMRALRDFNTPKIVHSDEVRMQQLHYLLANVVPGASNGSLRFASGPCSPTSLAKSAKQYRARVHAG